MTQCAEIRLAAWRFLVANNITTLPLDVNAVCRQNGWRLLALDVAENMTVAHVLDRAGTYCNCDAFSCWYKNSVLIFYKTSTQPGRRRFAIAHEFGHITLFHFHDLAAAEHEREANMFAARILMPLCVLHECGVRDAREISAMCGTSHTAARYRFGRLRYIEEQGRLYKYEIEKAVAEQFRPFVENYTREHGRCRYGYND